AADLVQRRVAMIVTNGIAVPTVRHAAGVIPIIFLTGYDPVRTGFVTSLSRPGGNMTGVRQTAWIVARVGSHRIRHCRAAGPEPPRIGYRVARSSSGWPCDRTENPDRESG